MGSCIIPKDFFLNADVHHIAKSLLGCILYTNIDDRITAGIITETESYAGIEDKACHAYGGRKTKRTRPMYEEGGILYIYKCYGLHHLLNIVTHKKEEPYAILIRSIEPLIGIETMLKRRNKQQLDLSLTCGPACVTKALGIGMEHNQIPFKKDLIWIENNKAYTDDEIISCKRIGIDYAQEFALKPWRYLIKDHPWVSQKKKIKT
ncbi:MAG TPA: DNA-3-methyladenine glycosylase [Chlamydiales bacterium]|nr:DNA-3-methyladenine glycosylase [Chlamydiales bacterium]